MLFDNEDDILDWTRQFYFNNPLLFNGNSFEKKILKYLQDKSSLISNNGHEALPPDYYSDSHSFMFDVMRVNDTEVKKTFNPVMVRERNLEKELRASGILNKVNPNCKWICNSESSDLYEHNYKSYKRNVNRVMKDHIDKIPIWISEHPEIKYKGLFVFDESECYFEGATVHVYDDDGNVAGPYIMACNEAIFDGIHLSRHGELIYKCWKKNHLVIHEPWNDEAFMLKAYDSDLDFLVFVYSRKPLGFPSEINKSYPSTIIADVRFPRTRPYKKYDTEVLVC